MNPACIRAKFSKERFIAPLAGELVSITTVPDPVFSERMMGDGFAIIPAEGIVVSPTDGLIINVFPTKHAVGIVSDEGYEFLIHVGIDTVKLAGEGFDAKIAKGQRVEKGQILMEFDLEYISLNTSSIITPVVITNLKERERVEILKTGFVELGEDEIMHITEADVERVV